MPRLSRTRTMAAGARVSGLRSVDRASRIAARPGDVTCLACKRRFSVTAGTPMHKITGRFLSAREIGSLKLASLPGLQYRTTGHPTHRIRAMMDGNPDLLRGIVERDETLHRRKAAL